MVVLVVTHDQSRRGRLMTTLRDRGYEVISAPHRQDLAATVRERHPALVVLDLYISNPNPLAVLEAMRREAAPPKVVALGGRSIRTKMAQAFGLGVDQVVGEVPAVEGQLDVDQVDSAIRTCFIDQIRRRASELWEAQGRPQGRDREHWAQAERDVLGLTPPHADHPSSSRSGDRLEHN